MTMAVMTIAAMPIAAICQLKGIFPCAGPETKD
jgi:hypothetical protein